MISFPSTYKRNSAELKARWDSIFISLERRVRAKGGGMLLIMLSLRMTTCHSPSRGSTQDETSVDFDKKQAFSSSASGTDALALASSKNIKKQRLGPLVCGNDRSTLSYAPVTVVTTTNRQGCELFRLPWNRRWSTGIGKVNEGSKAGHGSTTLSSRSSNGSEVCKTCSTCLPCSTSSLQLTTIVAAIMATPHRRIICTSRR